MTLLACAPRAQAMAGKPMKAVRRSSEARRRTSSLADCHRGHCAPGELDEVIQRRLQQALHVAMGAEIGAVFYSRGGADSVALDPFCPQLRLVAGER